MAKLGNIKIPNKPYSFSWFYFSFFIRYFYCSAGKVLILIREREKGIAMKRSLLKGMLLCASCVALAAALSGCGSQQSADSTSDDSASTGSGTTITMDGTDITTDGNSVADKVLADGVVNVGIANNNTPMNFIDEETGELTGFDVDLANALAEKMGVECNIVEVDNDTRIAYLTNGTVDMSITNLSHTTGRDAEIDFAEPSYIWDGKVAYAKKGQFDSILDLAGKKIAIDQGSSAAAAIVKAIEEQGGETPELVEFNGNAECFQALQDGKVDAWAQDSIICAGIAGDLGSDYETVGGFFSGSLYGIGVPSNDSAWRDEVSFALQEMMQDGTYDEIYDKWFGEGSKYELPYDVRPLLNADNFGENYLYTWPD